MNKKFRNIAQRNNLIYLNTMDMPDGYVSKFMDAMEQTTCPFSPCKDLAMVYEFKDMFLNVDDEYSFNVEDYSSWKSLIDLCLEFMHYDELINNTVIIRTSW